MWFRVKETGLLMSDRISLLDVLPCNFVIHEPCTHVYALARDRAGSLLFLFSNSSASWLKLPSLQYKVRPHYLSVDPSIIMSCPVLRFQCQLSFVSASKSQVSLSQVEISRQWSAGC